MFQRQRTGSVVCPSCGKLVGVNDEKCYSCGRPRPGMWGLTAVFRQLGINLSLDSALLWICGLIYVGTVILDPSAMFQGGLLSLLSPTNESMLLCGASGVLPVFGAGRWWTVLSAGLLHGGLLHIGFNLYALRFLGPLTAQTYGQGRFMIIFVASSVSGFIVSTVVGLIARPVMMTGEPALLRIFFNVASPGGVSMTLGASAGLCGLVGALLYYGRRAGSSILGQQAKTWVISILVFGLLIQGIDNWAHAGGFGAGYFLSMWLDPLKPERVDHQIAGIAGLGAMILAVVVSVLVGLPSR